MNKLTAFTGFAFLLTLAISGCGGGGGGGTDGGTTSNTQPPGNNTGNTPTQNTSTALITSYMSTAHQVEADAFTSDIIALNRQLASQGLSGSGSAVVQIKDLKLAHIHNFVTVCLQYAASTKGTLVLDKTSVKLHFNSYKATDSADITATITNQYTARGLSVNQSVLSSATTDVNNTYSTALLQIDAM